MSRSALHTFALVAHCDQASHANSGRSSTSTASVPMRSAISTSAMAASQRIASGSDCVRPRCRRAGARRPLRRGHYECGDRDEREDGRDRNEREPHAGEVLRAEQQRDEQHAREMAVARLDPRVALARRGRAAGGRVRSPRPRAAARLPAVRRFQSSRSHCAGASAARTWNSPAPRWASSGVTGSVGPDFQSSRRRPVS